MDHLELRKAWNNQKSEYKKTHAPQCRRCGYFSPWRSGCGLDIHHIKALIDGGDNSESNLVVLCHTCHDEWHRWYEPDGMTFDKFIQRPPIYIYKKIIDGELPFSYENPKQFIESWGDIKDYIMLHSPYKNGECVEYVKKHSSDWVDW